MQHSNINAKLARAQKLYEKLRPSEKTAYPAHTLSNIKSFSEKSEQQPEQKAASDLAIPSNFGDLYRLDQVIYAVMYGLPRAQQVQRPVDNTQQQTIPNQIPR